MGITRDSFTGKIGFILTSAGAAVGLGCIWRFPNLASGNGGGLFILTYLVLLAALGIPLMMTEVAIGRKTQSGALGAFKKLNPKFAFLGGMCLLAFGMIQPYYTVIGGEVLHYALLYTSGQGDILMNPEYYSSFLSSPNILIFSFVIFALLTGVVSILGVKKGLERFCKYVMPVMAILLVVLVVYCLTLPNGINGLLYYLTPDFSTFGVNTILSAMGQVFYSLSIGIGTMLTLGSYLDKKTNLVNSTCFTGIFNFSMAVIAGAVIIPASFICTNGNPAILGSGSVFASLPVIFQTIPLGFIIGAVFFILLFMVTLMANLGGLEMFVASMVDRFSMKRSIAVLLGTAYTLLLGTVICLGYGPLSWIQIGGLHLLELFDTVSGNILLPITAFLTCILVGYVIKPWVILDEFKIFTRFKQDKLYIFMIRYFCPICIITIFITNIVGMVL